MVIWGAIWGAILGLMWPGHGNDGEFIIGAVFGALAGWHLRRAVRKEIAKAGESAQASAAVAAALAREAREQRAAPEADGAPVPVAQPVAAAVAATTVRAAAPAAADETPTRQAAVATTPREPRPSAARAAEPLAPAEPTLADKLVARARDWLFGGNTVVRMGVLVLFVGLAFLAKYAVDNALVPPELRLAAIGAAGIALFVFGLRLRRRADDKLGYALTLQGAGIAVLYLTVFAAFRLYQFLPAGAAFVALGLICAFSAVIAVVQNAQVLAFIGFAGAFAAPILVSTGSGNHAALFGYYLLLGVAIAGIAWARAWRALNLLGFFATFGVATVWGVLKYRPQDLATTEPFLIGFFAIYLAASLFYALRHGQAARRAVDATLVFGVPIVAMGLQTGLVREIEYAAAFSSLALGALYLGLGWWLVRRQAGDAQVNRWLAECYAALGLGFVTLAVPLALDGRWTAAVWAVEGAGVYWMGRRQLRWMPRAAGLALQGMGAVLFIEATRHDAQGLWPFANPGFVGAAMLAGAALAIAWWSRHPVPREGASSAANAFAGLEDALSPLLLGVGFLWAQRAFAFEIDRTLATQDGVAEHVFGRGQRMLLSMLAWVGSAFALHHLALPRRADPWPQAAIAAWTVMPVLLFAALYGMSSQSHVFESGGWLAWPLALVLHGVMLRRLDAGPPRPWWPWVHAAGVWLLVLLAGNLLVFAIGKAQLWQTAWATVILLVAGSVGLLALTHPRWTQALAQPEAARWPLAPHAAAYVWRAAAPLAVGLALLALLVAVHSNGRADPLPYVPLLNPTDLTVALALGVCALWLGRVRGSVLALPGFVRGTVPPGVLAALCFVAINTIWLRVAHHYAGVPWNAGSLFASFTVQAGYSILWTVIALVLMVAAHRQAWRTPWMLGAALLGLTVLKLFVIDLSNRGGSERIVVFIAVGLLMLVVGWFAPLPPAMRPQDPPQGDVQEATS